MELEIIVNFILAVSIGAIIGLEREIHHQKEKVHDFAGIRSFILIAVLGFILTYISINVFNSISAFIVGFAAFMFLIIAAYTVLAIKTGRIGATTEIAAMITFLLSAIITSNMTKDLKIIAIIIGVVVATLLAIKEHLHKFAKNVKMSEVYATIKMALISIIILPFLPNKTYNLMQVPLLKDILGASPKIADYALQLNVFNPFKIWLVVVFISGLSFIGYILMKTVGVNKGIGLTSLLGGLISSTAVTVALSEKSRGKKMHNTFIFGIVLASSVMFIRILILAAALAPRLIKYLALPLVAMAIFGFISSFVISKKDGEKKHEKIEFNTPFAINPALKFTLFLVAVLIISKLLFIVFGNSGAYIAGLVSGLADVDAITITLSSLVVSGAVAEKVAALGIILAICSNTFVKAMITRMSAEKKVAKGVAIVFAITFIIGLAIVILL